MALSQLDPSLVLGFVCISEADFDDLCLHFEHEVLGPEASQGHPLFELHRTRPSNLPPRPSTIIPRSNDECNCLDSFGPTADLLVEADGDGTISSLEPEGGGFGGTVNTMRKFWLNSPIPTNVATASLTTLFLGPARNRVQPPTRALFQPNQILHPNTVMFNHVKDGSLVLPSLVCSSARPPLLLADSRVSFSWLLKVVQRQLVNRVELQATFINLLFLTTHMFRD
ncbi:unnamed protein product [Dicrocoelium dendriticum]|nr:unnamed protein product [Dicrocoelium dendriticum]